MAKPTSIKIWPEIEGYVSAIIPFQKINGETNSLSIDFSNCYSITSSGLNILLIQLIKSTIADNFKGSWYLIPEDDNDILKVIDKLNFFNLLEGYINYNDLYENQNLNNTQNVPIERVNSNKIISFPIYNINFKKFEDRRKGLSELKDWLLDKLDKYYQKYDFLYTQLISIIIEIAKNSADHTSDNAFLGMDIIHIDDKIKICFSIGDLGMGINRNIKENLLNTEDDNLKKRIPHWDITQTYRKALEHGFTTLRNSKINKGLGMSIILDGSKGMNLNLSVFDANSRGILNKINRIDHEDIRRNFIDIGRSVGFFYYGELVAKAI